MSRRLLLHSLLLLSGTVTLVRTQLPDHRFFLQEIFNKYGDRGVMSFEGFEHLLESLGLGHLEFEKRHNVSVHRVNGTFTEMHDELELHTHNHSREKREAELEEELEQLVSYHLEISSDEHLSRLSTGMCLSPQDILRTYGLKPNHEAIISPARFIHLCPAIVYELDQRTCYEAVIDQLPSQPEETLIKNSSWLYASISILIMSVTGFLIVFIVPVMNSLKCYHQILHFLVALAVGTLCGDAFLHLLPHAMASKDPRDTTEAVPKAATAFGALIFFFTLESMIKLIKSETRVKPKVDVSETLRDQTSKQLRKDTVITIPSDSHGHRHSHSHADGSKSVTFMVMLGDAIHNVTDGLAIGAAFSGDTVAGIATSVAVFCHELPHEVGDFAVLIKSGISIRHALLFNIVSSVLSVIGMVIGVFLGNIENSTEWIYAVTAGVFLYIALCDLIPEMSHYSEGSVSMISTILQLAGMLLGGFIMVMIALYEDALQSVLGSSS